MMFIRQTRAIGSVVCVTPLLAFFALKTSFLAPRQVQRFAVTGAGPSLVITVLRDDILHFDFVPTAGGASTSISVPMTEMVQRRDYPGPSWYRKLSAESFETRDLLVKVRRDGLCVDIKDLSRSEVLHTACPKRLANGKTTLEIDPRAMENAYGLGEQFVEPGEPDGDWVGRVRSPGNEFGNAHVEYNGGIINGGIVGNAQFPILYAVGPEKRNYALFIDNVHAHRWDFRSRPWTLEVGGGDLRWFYIAGNSLADLRSDYMDLTGRPPVPPRAAFGLWVSEYGFENWKELDDKLKTLRLHNFPVDAFVLDLQWFGGVIEASEKSPMGGLVWDRQAFPDPAGKIRQLREKDGVGLALIEESYVSRKLPIQSSVPALRIPRGAFIFDVMDQKGFLPKSGPTPDAPGVLLPGKWMGKGGYIDWTVPEAGAFWHDWKRQPLIDQGVIAHWIDLGEPDLFDPKAYYSRGTKTHAEVHNIYNLKWAQSIYQGYARNKVKRRPLLLSRSGSSGLQRYGAAMWSGDIGTNLSSYRTHLNVHMHMSLSGVDFFGSDTGGFHMPKVPEGDFNETFTQWFANSALHDVPVRVHTENLCHCKEVAPDRVGDRASNLENLRLRYRLVPYYYSLAHSAALFGSPVVAPPVFYFQEDPIVREMGSQKMIGPFLMSVSVARHGQKEARAYLPRGSWYEFRTGRRIASRGQWLERLPLWVNGRFQLPLFARAGAVIPEMPVDEFTLNTTGLRKDGKRRQDLIVRVFPGETPTNFTLFEDDGETIAYQSGAFRKTVIKQMQDASVVQVAIEADRGTYSGAPVTRDIALEMALESGASFVTVNGREYPLLAPSSATGSGWRDDGKGFVRIQIEKHPVAVPILVTVRPKAVRPLVTVNP